MGLDTFGKGIKRREDPRLITGKGTYVDNMKMVGMAHAYILRSPYAHARIIKIDVAKAKAQPGVLDVFVGKDMEALGSIPCGWSHPGLITPKHPVVAIDEVNYVGDPVAVIVAEDRYIARDAADLIDVEYDPLPAVIDLEKAVASREQARVAAAHADVHHAGAHHDEAAAGEAIEQTVGAEVKAALASQEAAGPHLVHNEAAHNTAFTWTIGDKAKTDEAFAKAAHVTTLRIRNNRIQASAIEPRAALASYDAASEGITLWMTSQNPHIHRLLAAAFVLGIPEHKLRVIAPDVGGGFGSKIFVYGEEIIVVWASRKLGVPVKWASERREAYISDAHGRDHVTTAEMAFDAGGRITGLRVKTLANLGAYLSTFSTAVPTYLYGTLLSGQYDIPTIFCEVLGVLTNTVPVDAVRGAGRPEATFLLERLMDTAARELKMEPTAIRRKNFIQPNQFPYQTAVALQYDSGNYEVALDKALEMVGYADLRKQQAEARKQGKLIGIGVSTYLEACGLAPSALVGSLGAGAGQWESALVRVMPTGTINVYTGSHSHGQGHETTFAQVVSRELGVPYENINILHGDTETLPYGWGTYGSRSAAVGGSALVKASQRVREKAIKIAAHLLEANEADVELVEGKFQVKGAPSRSKSWFDIGLQSHLAHNLPQGMEPGLEFTAFYDPSNFVYPFGAHICVTEVDADTGQVQIKRFIAVDDCGNRINPMIIDGQVHGGLACGIGQALYEEAAYTDEGQPLFGSMMDYALPRAHFLPSFELGHTVTPCPHNPLGVKGIGETGAIGSPPAVVNSVVDALAHLGVTHIDMPLTPEKVWRAMNAM
ncbi:MAG: molybdopterin-dependent oxidoreductase [Chloroflexi bacterium]|nr:molybdopterin-dependent oxidoreductase [Chloroflexota bacterium]